MSNARTQLPAAVLDAMRRGDKLGAIKLLRQATQLGLAEAKGVVDGHLQGDTGSGHSMETSASRSSPTNANAAAGIAAHSHAVLNRVSRPGLSPGEVPRSAGSGGAIAILLAVAAVVAIAVLKGPG